MKVRSQDVKRIIGGLIVAVALSGFATGGWCAPPALVVVASTSWTGAVARAAGATEIVVLAPLELKHPPEYDYRPADIARLGEARLLIHAGYEPFVKKLTAAAAFPPEKTLQIATVNDPEALKGQARLLAERLGTQEREKVWEAAFDKTIAQIKGKATQKGVGQIRILVQQMQVPFVKWLGYAIAGTFSVNELSPARILELAALKPELIVDNIHNPQGRPIREVVGCTYVELRNFPSAQAPTLEGLFLENAAQLGLR